MHTGPKTGSALRRALRAERAQEHRADVAALMGSPFMDESMLVHLPRTLGLFAFAGPTMEWDWGGTVTESDQELLARQDDTDQDETVYATGWTFR
jgi:hypothetical protein